MNDNKEVFASIMSDMRTAWQDLISHLELPRGTGYARVHIGQIANQYFDRLEAAHQRERGDVAVLRAALTEALDHVNDVYDTLSKSCVEIEKARQGCREARGVLIPALAAPPRNCDRFNTGDPLKDSEDAYDAWQRYCDDQSIPPSCKVESAFKNWLFAPATEKEGGNDAD